MCQIFKEILETGKRYSFSESNYFVVEPRFEGPFFEGRLYCWTINTKVLDPESTYSERVLREVNRTLFLGIPALFEVEEGGEVVAFSVEITFCVEDNTYLVGVSGRKPSFSF